MEYLKRVGYYRLSGYWFGFRIRSDGNPPVLDNFKLGATFEDAVKLYEFDKQLRLLVLEALESIEIALRVAISHTLGQLDPFAHTKTEFLHSTFTQEQKGKEPSKHQDWLNGQKKIINRSKEAFVIHHKKKYDGELPVWVVCEIWDFGMLSKLLSMMREKEQDAIASRYGIKNGRIFASWVRSLHFLRNVCAHHSRLWNRNITEQSKLPPASEVAWVAPFEQNQHARARCYLLLCMVRHLLRVIEPTSTWPQRMKEHLQRFPSLEERGINLKHMGVIEDRESFLIAGELNQKRAP